MQLVVDFNVVFSALVNKKGNPSRVFEANRELKQFEFASPEFLLLEVGNRMGKLLLKSGLTKEEMSEALSIIKQDIRIVPFSDFADRLPEAIELNFKDSPYIALALKLDCPIFSGDKGLKEQSKIKVLSPRELLSKMGLG